MELVLFIVFNFFSKKKKEFLTSKLTREPTATLEIPIPLPFQTPTSHPPLSLAFRSPARSGDRSGSDWRDIESRLAL